MGKILIMLREEFEAEPTQLQSSGIEAALNDKEIEQDAKSIDVPQNNEEQINPVVSENINNPPEEIRLNPSQCDGIITCLQTFSTVPITFFTTLGVNLIYVMHDAIVGGSVVAMGAIMMGIGIALAAAHFAILFAGHLIADMCRSEAERLEERARIRADNEPKCGLFFRSEGNYLIRRGMGLGPLQREAICISLPESPETAECFESDKRNGCLPSVFGGTLFGAVSKAVMIPYDICASTGKATALSGCGSKSQNSVETIVCESTATLLKMMLIDPGETDKNLPDLNKGYGDKVAPQPNMERDFKGSLAGVLNEEQEYVKKKAEEILRNADDLPSSDLEAQMSALENKQEAINHLAAKHEIAASPSRGCSIM